MSNGTSPSPLLTKAPATETFKKSGKEIVNTEFTAPAKKDKNVYVFAKEGASVEAFASNWRIWKDYNNNEKYEPKKQESVIYDFEIFVFISQSELYLRELFKRTNPASYEVCLFLEDNNNDILSGSSAYVKMGDKARKQIEDKYLTAPFKEKFNLLATIKEESVNFELALNPEQIKELIEHGSITNITSSTAIGLMQVMNAHNMLLAPVYSQIGEGIAGFTDFLKNTIKFKPHHWDPEAKVRVEVGKEGEKKTNKNFEPVLFPGDRQQMSVKEMVIHMKKALEEKNATIESYIKGMGNINLPAGMSIDLSPDFLNQFMVKVYKQVINPLVQDLISAANKVVTTFSFLKDKAINAINAFYCGLWNSLVSAVVGLIDIVALIFKGMGGMGNFMRNAQVKVPQVREIIDEAIQSFSKLDFARITDEIIKQVKKIKFSDLTPALSIEKIAYFMGAVVGFVIEIIIDILLTGGTKALATVARQLGDMGKRFVTRIKSVLGKVFGKSLRQQTADLFKMLKQLVLYLKQGTDKIVASIRKLFKATVDDIKKVADNSVKKIKDKFNISDQQQQLLDDLGLHFMKYDGGDVAKLCKIT